MKRITKKWIGRRPVIIFDYDDVLFDFLGKTIEVYNQKMNTNINVDDVKSWDLSETGDIQVFMQIIRNASLWKTMTPKKNAIEVVQRLINDGRYTVLICTACNTLAEYVVKVQMIKEMIPGFDTSKIITVTDKYLIRGDVIIDDKIENCDDCAPYMKCILMDMPHNRECTKYQRITDLSELEKILEEMFWV